MRRSSELIVADLVNGGCIDDFDQVYVLDDSLLTPFPTLFHGAARVPGLPIRDCTRGYNNRGQSRPMISAIEVTAKTFFERLYLLLGLREIALPMHPTTPTPTTIFSIFFAIFFCEWPLIFLVITIHEYCGQVSIRNCSFSRTDVPGVIITARYHFLDNIALVALSLSAYGSSSKAGTVTPFCLQVLFLFMSLSLEPNVGFSFFSYNDRNVSGCLSILMLLTPLAVTP